MTAYHAEHAWLPTGWARDVMIETRDGAITAVRPGMKPGDAMTLHGPVMPGMIDAHSHAFQRAMAGLTERAGPADDSFWSWRDTMYRFLAKLGPDEIEAIATQLYVELVKHGYTSVAEFHYVHNDPTGAPYENPGELAERIVAAAGAAGMGLTLLPVLYQASDFGGKAPSEGQRRFVLSTDAFLALIESLAHRHRRDGQVAIGIAPHSLRAVTLESLTRVVGAITADAPVHIHIAEQTREVEACLAWSGQRPVEWLLHHAPVDRRWCLVHATHMTADETRALAKSHAVAGLCPTTEANLGDGFFNLGTFLAAHGRFAIGSDSNVSVSPVEELRWLEYGQRLLARARNVSEPRPGQSTGEFLFAGALAGGTAASGRKLGAITPGARADFVVLDGEHPALLGRGIDRVIDSWIFSGNSNPVRDVMVGGEWAVREGHHVHEDQARAGYARALAKLKE